jgi:hypothetical protein
LGVGAVIHHQLDDVARRAELAVLPGAGDLAEHVLVQVALGVGVGHVDAVELVDHVGQHARRRHHEDGVLHVVRVGRVALLLGAAVAAQRLDEGEHLVLDRGKHLLRGRVLEPRPAQVVLLGLEDRLLDRLAGADGLALAQRVQLVQPLDEQQIRQLLDDRQRVRDAAGPHRVPDTVHLGPEFARNHARTVLLQVIATGGEDASIAIAE